MDLLINAAPFIIVFFGVVGSAIITLKVIGFKRNRKLKSEYEERQKQKEAESNG